MPRDVDSLALADREEELNDWLDERGVAGAWRIAPGARRRGRRSSGGASASGEILDGDTLEPGLEWVASTYSSAALLAEAKDATTRISELVAAVRSYSQLDRASLQSIDVTEGIESTLVMLGHKLRGGVDVVRDYDPELGPIEALPGELNQVWTNLIDNAIDAMDGKGTLRVATAARRRLRRRGDRRHAAPECPPKCRPARSIRSSRPRTSAREPASVSTSHAASSSSATSARSRSTPCPGGP